MARVKKPESPRLERRRFARFDVERPVEYPLFGETAFANTENISRGGMLVGGVPILPDGEVEFSLHGATAEPLILIGRVCRHGEAGAHVEFLDVAGGRDPALEQFIERTIIPGLIGNLTGARRDSHTLRLVSSWYRELGDEDRALEICRRAMRDAPNAAPYEELAALLMTRAKRFGAHGGLEQIAEARQVIGQGLKRVASPVLVRLYQESVGLEERLRESAPQPLLGRMRTTEQRDVPAELESTTSQRPIPPEILAEARRTDLSIDDTMTTDPMVPIELPPGLVATDLSLHVRPATVDAVAAAFAADAPLTDPMRVAPVARSTEALPEIRPRRRRWVVALLVVITGAGTWMWRSGFIQIPTRPRPIAVPTVAPADAARILPPSIRDDDESYQELAELEPELLAHPPQSKNHKKRRSRRRRHAPRATTAAEVQPMDAPAPAVSPATGDRYERAKAHFKGRKMLLAIEELEALIREQPRHADAHRMLGVAYSLVGREPSSIESFRRFVEIAPSHKHAPKIRAIIVDYERRNPGR